MKKTISVMLLATVILCNLTQAQNSTLFPKGDISKTDNHTGTVWLTELNTTDSNFNFSIAQATFSPGAKLDWHIHPVGQYLLITEGTGYYQERGKSIQIVQKGDFIKCLPGIEHWHGAAPTSDFSYLGVTPVQKGKTIWLKRVTDEEYNSAKSTKVTSSNINNTNAEQEIINLSNNKWRWMADRKVDSLNALFNEKAVFVHMGATFNKTQELDVIRTGSIQYKYADIQETSVRFIANTAILLHKLRLTAIVGGNEVVNPFSVTEVYIHENNKWTLGSISFTKLVTQ